MALPRPGRRTTAVDAAPRTCESRPCWHATSRGGALALGTAVGPRMARMPGRSTEVGDERLLFEQTPFPGAPFVPRAYRGRTWFLPAAGEWFRVDDGWRRRGTRPIDGAT